MQYSEDLSAAGWLVDSDAGPDRVITFGPAVFEAYARLRYLPDPAGPGLAETDAQVADDHRSDLDQARTVLAALAAATTTPSTCFFGVWEGYTGSFLDPVLTRGPMVALPHRRYVLFTGALEEMATWADRFGHGQPCPPPALVWPADHRWCFASDVDPHWAGIGADDTVIESLTARTDVDDVRARPDRVLPRYDR